MVTFPNCKINIGLYITDKRSDGFHNLQTVFFPIPVFDALEIISSASTASKRVSFSTSGTSIDGDLDKNLCVKAYTLLQLHFPDILPVKMHLLKKIPIGAGLGGGSADGAFALKMLNEMFSLALNKEQLISFALQLGSDCPFFIINKPCLASGRGEVLKEVNVNLSKYRIMIVNPGIHINTGWAFSNITPCKPSINLEETIALPVYAWKDKLENQFEKPVFNYFPQIELIKSRLYQAGAIYASMSGSGSTVFGIFEKAAVLPNFSTDYLVKIV